jgi:hypothetical protein
MATFVQDIGKEIASYPKLLVESIKSIPDQIKKYFLSWKLFFTKENLLNLLPSAIFIMGGFSAFFWVEFIISLIVVGILLLSIYTTAYDFFGALQGGYVAGIIMITLGSVLGCLTVSGVCVFFIILVIVIFVSAKFTTGKGE